MNKLYPLHATIGSLLLLGALAACNDKDELMCDLPHPHPGHAVIAYGWGTATPHANGVRLTLLPGDDPAATPAYDALTPATGITLDRLAPGTYHALAHTEAEAVSINAGTAYATPTDDGHLPPVGDLRAGTARLAIESDRDTRTDIALQPCTRLLRIALRADATEDPAQVASLTGILTGVRARRTIDPWLANAAPEPATPATGSIRLTFALNADGTAFTAGQRILGIDPTADVTLSLTLTTTDGRTDSQDYDLDDELDDFDNPDSDPDNPGGDDPDNPFDLEGDIDLTITSPVDALFGISGWGQVDNTQGGADMEI